MGLSFALCACEPVTERVWRGYGGSAATNPWYAAEEVLALLGVPTSRVAGLRPPEATDEVLLVLVPTGHLAPPQVDRLEAWIRAGGHLVIVTGADDDAGEHPLLAPRQLAVVPWDWESEVVLEVPERVRVEGSDQAVWALDCRALGGDGSWAWAAHCEVGEGALTVLTAAPFHNGALGELDHARALWRLVTARHDPPSAVRLVSWVDDDRLWPLVWERLWRLLVAGGVLVGAWGWGASGRFGPTLPAPDRVRRGLVEQLDAQGAWRFSQGDARGLLEPIHRATLGRVRRRGEPTAPVEALLQVDPSRPGPFAQVVRNLLEFWRKR